MNPLDMHNGGSQDGTMDKHFIIYINNGIVIGLVRSDKQRFSLEYTKCLFLLCRYDRYILKAFKC